MTFEQFQATRRHSTVLAKDVDLSLGASSSGYIYLGCYVIEDVNEAWHETARAQGKHYLLLIDEEFFSDDLEELERRLYAFAQDEGATDNAN